MVSNVLCRIKCVLVTVEFPLVGEELLYSVNMLILGIYVVPRTGSLNGFFLQFNHLGWFVSNILKCILHKIIRFHSRDSITSSKLQNSQDDFLESTTNT
jgi:hypothetical protein